MDETNHYKILNISQHADYKEIKSAYRRMVRKYHPDKNPHLSDETMKKINLAFEILSDDEKRIQYDKSLSKNVLKNVHIDVHENEDSFTRIRTEWEFININKDFKKENIFDYYEDGNHHIHSEQRHFSEEISKDNEKSYNMSRYHIMVEPSLCMAFGSCETLAPKVFVLEKNKQFNPKAIVRSETEENFDKILDAAKTCPTKAIIIIDRYTGENIYP